MGLRLALLGPPRVERDGEAVRFDTRKAVALLAMLAVPAAPANRHGRDQLAATLWPSSDTAHARAALRRTLSATVATIGDALALERGTVRLMPGSFWVDVEEFERLAGAADEASLTRAADLYREDFLAGFTLRDSPAFDDWQRFVADGLRQRLAGVLDTLLEARVSRGAYGDAIEAARRRLVLDPLHEPAHQALIRLYTETGERGAALRQYRDCVRVLDRELGVSPLPETRALYEAVRSERPPARGAAVAAGRHIVRRPGTEAKLPVRAARAPLVGRAEELACLLDSWRRAGTAGAAGRIATVVGPAGIGKTRLVEELIEQVRTAGAPVLAARCHEGEAALAYGVATSLAPATLLPAGSAVGAPAAAGGALAGPLGSPAAQVQLFQAVWAALKSALSPAASPGSPPGVVVVEDLQWIDDASADLLAWLLRRLASFPILAVLTWRPDADELTTPSRGVPAALRAAIRDCRERGEVDDVRPDALLLTEVAELVADLPQVDPKRLRADTGGLPLLVTAYADALRATGGAAGLEPPTRVRELLLGQVGHASEATRQVLAAAAVLGGRAAPRVLRLTSGRGEAETVDALEEAVRLGLLIESGSGYDFPHQALRRVVEESTSLARRQLLHGRAADVLMHEQAESSPAVAGAVAAHLREAGRHDEAAAWASRAAAEASRLYAHVEALAHLQDALALGWRAAQTHRRIGDTLTVLGRYRDAIAAYEQTAAEAEDPAALAEIEHKLADVRLRLGDLNACEDHLRAALDLLSDGRHEQLRARVVADRALVTHRRGDDDAAARYATEALRIGTAAGDGKSIVQAHCVLGIIAAVTGRFATGEEHLRTGLARARAEGDIGLTVAALNNLARALAAGGRTSDALEPAREALDLGRHHGDLHRVAALHTNLADLLHAAGHRDEAEQQQREAAKLFAEIDHTSDRQPLIWTLVEW
jgi:DNA-binding SARP family transcriptional activator